MNHTPATTPLSPSSYQLQVASQRACDSISTLALSMLGACAGFQLMQALCTLSQRLWVHVCNCPALPGNTGFLNHFWVLQSFCSLFCRDPWALAGRRCYVPLSTPVSQSLHAKQFWVSVLPATKRSFPVLRATLIYDIMINHQEWFNITLI